MPTRKQRRRDQKSKRHEYEFVYVDSEGNEVDEVPDELEQPPKRERTNGSKPAVAATAKDKKGSTSSKRPQGRQLRQPAQPSWNRALKRGGMLGIVVFVLFSLTAKGHYASVLPLALLYTLLFVPFTYYIDRFAYRRWETRQAGTGTPAKSAKSSGTKKR
jgi:hypothetical protein